MSVDTIGKIKGYISPEDITMYIKEKYDAKAKNCVQLKQKTPIKEVTWEYKINEHSKDNENWCSTYGFIEFTHNGETRSLFYSYDNINHFENLKYYEKYGLEDMVKAETTHISLGHWGASIEIIKDIIIHFGGGWLDENDCDENNFYWVN